MRRLGLLLAASAFCAVAAAGAACTSILGVDDLPDPDAGAADAATMPDATRGGDGGDVTRMMDAGDGAVADTSVVMLADAGTVQTLAGMAPELFGTAVALSPDGHWLAVGAPGYGNPSFSGSADNVGAVFLYERTDAGAYEQSMPVGTLAPTDFGTGVAGGEFGQSLAFSRDGTLLAVGAPHTWRPFVPDVGSVFVYGLVPGHGFTAYTDLVPTLPANTQFGFALAFGAAIATPAYGAQLYVGAPGGSPASVYSYAFAYGDAGNGAYWGAVDSPGDAGDFFGGRLAATSASTVFVGAPGAVTASGTGAAFVFDLTGTTAPEAGVHPTMPSVGARMLAVPHGAGYELGAALAVTGDGTQLAIGAPGESVNDVSAPLGEVFRLTSDAATDAAAYAVSAPLSGGSTAYGTAVAIAASTFVVGDPGATVAGSTSAGAVYRYAAQLDAQAAATVLPPQAVASGFFGVSLACTADGATLVVGAPGTGSVSGNVYIYSD